MASYTDLDDALATAREISNDGRIVAVIEVATDETRSNGGAEYEVEVCDEVETARRLPCAIRVFDNGAEVQL